MKYTWDYYAKLARNIAKHIITGDEVMRDGTRYSKATDIQDINATKALNQKFLNTGSWSSIHTWPGGKQEISTRHRNGTEGVFYTTGEYHGTNNPMDVEVQQYIQNNIDESITYNKMKKNTIRLTESQLKSLIKESVNRILKERISKDDIVDANDGARRFIPMTKGGQRSRELRRNMDFANKQMNNPTAGGYSDPYKVKQVQDRFKKDREEDSQIFQQNKQQFRDNTRRF